MGKGFKHTVFWAAMVSVCALALSACGSSKGPGEIGSKSDIVITNAGDDAAREIAEQRQNNIQPKIDPVTQAHQQAVAEAKPVIEEQAANDPDQTPVPGDEPEVTMVKENVVVQGEVLDNAAVETLKDAEPEDLKEPILEAPAEEEIAAPVPDMFKATQQREVKVVHQEEHQPYMEPKQPASTQTPQQILQQSGAAALPSGLVAGVDAPLIRAVQQSLSDKGYYFGSIDGALGAETLNALHLYQSAHGIETYGMTHETLRKLGVNTSRYQ